MKVASDFISALRKKFRGYIKQNSMQSNFYPHNLEGKQVPAIEDAEDTKATHRAKSKLYKKHLGQFGVA